MKEKADENLRERKRNARECLIRIGDHVLLKQNRADALTAAYDP